jgi:hypothetical protein
MQHSAAVSTMPQTSATANVTTSSGSSSNIERIFLAALKSYKEKTKKDLKEHDLFRQLETCDSPAAILAVFQAKQFDSSRAGNNDRLKKWLTPTINVLYAFSNTLGEGISLVNIDASCPSLVEYTLMPNLQVFPPAKVIFAGVGVLLLVSGLVHPSRLVDAHVTLIVLRRLRMSRRAKTSSLTSSDALRVSACGSRITLTFR